MRLEKIAVDEVVHQIYGCKRTATQYAVPAIKPRRRIFAIAIRRETGVRRERRRRPFPHAIAPVDSPQSRCGFPFLLARQTPAHPVAVRVCFQRADVYHRRGQWQCNPLIERAHLPRRAATSPKFWMLAPGAFTVLPRLNEAQKLRMGHRASINLKALDRCCERGTFVIKTEARMIVTKRKRRGRHGDRARRCHLSLRSHPVWLRQAQGLRAPG